MRFPRRNPELGASTIEYLGVGAVIVALVLAVVVAAPGVGAAVGDAVETLVCRVTSLVTGQDCGAQDGDGPQAPLEVPEPPPVGTDPGEVADWWAGLAPEQRAAVIEADPDVIGALDGLPATVRHDANMIVLERVLAATEAEIARPEAELRAAGDGTELARLNAVRADAVRVHEMLTTVREQVSAAPNRTLLLLDTSGQGRAAIGIGDVDTADHVAVVVPGLNTTITSDLVGNAQRLQTATNRLTAEVAGDGSVATVAWLGYETPSFGNVALRDNAEDGAEYLNSTLHGLEASRTAGGGPANPLHLTLIGHSYGSLTSGLTVRGETPVDDVVFLGSPGAGADNAGELRVPAGHVFVGEAGRDAVGDFNHFGRDPSAEGFGARTFDAREAVDPRTGEVLAESTGHSAYFHTESSSLQNQAYITLGRDDLLIGGTPSGAGDWIARRRQDVRDFREDVEDFVGGVGDFIGGLNPF